jgi:surfeit locus 1 family protein
MTTKSLQFHIRGRAYRYTFKIGFFLLCLIFFVVLCQLGIWQLHRYHYKKDLLTAYDQRLHAAPISFMAAMKNPQNLRFQSVTVTGHYEDKFQMVISNRYYQDKPGFEVLTPLRIQGDNKLLLVDRGWIEKTTKPLALPKISGDQHITGYIKLLDERQFILGNNILEPNSTPVVIQKIDIADINALTHEAFYPFVLRLNPAQPNGFVRDWIISASPPERHFGYAIQWFAMALVLLIAYFCFACERIKDDSTH